MTSTVGDILTSAAAIGEGSLLSPESHALQLAPLTAKFPPWNDTMWYGFGVFVINGWIVQNPSFAGYAATMAYLPARKLGDRGLDDDAAGGVAGGQPLDRPAEGDRRGPRAGGAALGARPSSTCKLVGCDGRSGSDHDAASERRRSPHGMPPCAGR